MRGIKTSADSRKFLKEKLSMLLDITRAINRNDSADNLFGIYSHFLRDQLNIGKLLVYMHRQSQWQIIIAKGVVVRDYCHIMPEQDFLKYVDIEYSLKDEKFSSFDSLIPVLHETTPLAYVLIGDLDDEQAGMSPTIRNLTFIQTLTNIIVTAIENKRLIEENMQQERFKKEMEMAANMQSMLIPHADIFANDKHVNVEAFYLPHYEVGGDYYDFDYLGNDEMFFCIADVSGKGMSAAILMSNFQASLKALFTPDMELDTLVRRLNSIIVRNSNGDRFITLFIGRYCFSTKELRYVNAGHNSPILYNFKTNSSIHLDAGCPGIGMLDEIPKLEVGCLKLDGYNKLLCFTDGVVELEKPNIPDYGMQVVEAAMSDSKPIKETISTILEQLEIKRSNPALFDDITILGIDFI